MEGACPGRKGQPLQTCNHRREAVMNATVIAGAPLEVMQDEEKKKKTLIASFF
jgi:hypothetical protein